MTEKERYDWDLNGIWDYNDESDEYIESYEDITKLLNEQDEQIETLKEDVEIILDYVLNKGKFAMTVKEQKAHNRLRDFIREDME